MPSFPQDTVEHSIGLITALTPYIGYDRASALAQLALHRNASVLDLVAEAGVLSPDQLSRILDPRRLAGPLPMSRDAAVD